MNYLILKNRILNSKLMMDSFWSLFGNVIGKSLALAAGIIVARYLGKDIYGEYGIIINNSSNIIEFGSQVVSACIIVLIKKMNQPLLAFSMTHPKYKNRGMATFLLKKGINNLYAQGYPELYLFVTEGIRDCVWWCFKDQFRNMPWRGFCS